MMTGMIDNRDYHDNDRDEVHDKDDNGPGYRGNSGDYHENHGIHDDHEDDDHDGVLMI